MTDRSLAGVYVLAVLSALAGCDDDTTTGVSAATVAALEARLAAVEGSHGALEARVAALESENATLTAALAAATQRLATVEHAADALATGEGALDGRVAALETKTEPLSRQTIDGYEALVVEGVNVHVRNGMDATRTTNGVGNLIVGYNETRIVGDVRTGSHNLVLGEANNYSSFGAAVFGYNGSSQAPFASVLGGSSNDATAARSIVLGGDDNTASGMASVVVGGQLNVTTGFGSSIGGGKENRAGGQWATVTGGQHNEANAFWSSISGGTSLVITNIDANDHAWKAGNYSWVQP